LGMAQWGEVIAPLLVRLAQKSAANVRGLSNLCYGEKIGEDATVT